MEEIISNLNGLGWFQIRTILLIATPPMSLQGLWQMTVFWGQTLPHTCSNANGTGSVIENYKNWTTENADSMNDTQMGDPSCSMETTYPNDFGLLCDNAYIKSKMNDPFFYGVAFGQIISGIAQDVLGRRTVLVTCGVLLWPSMLVIVFSQSYQMYMIGTGLCGILTSGLGAYTLPMEIVSANKRFIVGILITLGWVLNTSIIYSTIIYLRLAVSVGIYYLLLYFEIGDMLQ